MLLPEDVDVEALPPEELARLVGALLGEVVRLRDENAALKEESARLTRFAPAPPPDRPAFCPAYSWRP